MLALNYALLKYFTKVDEASVEDVMKALEPDYKNFRSFNKKAMTEAIMTAEKNGLLEETRYTYNDKHEVVTYYHAHDEGKEVINSYIK